MASSEEPVIIVGAGLAGLVAAYELSQRNIHTIIVDQENAANLGGQAFWSLGGIFCVDSSNQRRLGIRDSRELAMQDWFNSAGFDRETDLWPRKWAEAFVNFATDDLESYLNALGVRFTSVGWAERGSGMAGGHGNSVPRFHITWGTGPAIVEAFAGPVREAEKKGLVDFRFRHRVNEIVVDPDTGAALGVRGQVLEPTNAERGVSSSRVGIYDFELLGPAVLISSGGIGGNLGLVKKYWPVDRLGPKVPRSFVLGVPAHVDGRMIEISQKVGANVINSDRMWHYTEGLTNWDPIWPQHGIRVIPGPSSLWLDATGRRLPPFLYPGCDTLATLRHICSTGYDYTWFVLNKTIIAREFALSGSEQNPDITNKSILLLLQRLFGSNGTGPVQAFMKNGEDFIVEPALEELLERMGQLGQKHGGPLLDKDQVQREIKLRDSQTDNEYTKDAQLMLIRNARNFWPDKYTRVVKPHKLLDPRHGPLIAVRMNLLTRKTLGGLETDLSANVLRSDGTRFTNLYAAGEVVGFGGGGVHGYNSLEGTFLGGCIFLGRTAGIAIAEGLAGLLVQIES
ncbi:FAD-binding dehydrogenase [Aspergillus clavatus NRRL 1]|uniref:3-ketosteroid-delta-1-dehydrogenase, putative n=1 Tax=Aspergillus clavatus (strain ATCC 1007 / CBS 513.65 / DSM 816 / NCTC 3887 / NRRL 1 / QM 1276 / 107) TaxID=344612 RepID=A1CBU3_ASPCL|nr:3-ketosteroid-delta-1-dehydrogenase, putative [Aspergillus clavatus NRRL 1]EAW13211.1 3-ketosteroid-delta-1-dehydrogenase, putative [Aspergillus clavatus NRRL 1]